MKKYALIAAMALILAAPAAWCQQNAPGGNGGPPPQGAGGGQPDSQGQFQQHKAQILKFMGERLAELQERQKCVEAANDHDALMACMPQRGDHGGPGGPGGMQHGGMQHNGMQHDQPPGPPPGNNGQQDSQ